MNRRKQLILFRVLFVLYVTAVLLLCFLPMDDVSQFPRFVLGFPIDKVVHFCMFFPFPLLAFLAFDPYTDTVPSTLAFAGITLMVGLLLALGTEWGQEMLTDYRCGDPADLVADSLALVSSTVIVIIWDILKQRLTRRSCEKASS